MVPGALPPADDPAVPFRSTPLPLDSLGDAGPKALFAYWNRKLAGRRMPARSDIDPLDLKTVLPHLVLLDVQRTPLDFRYRVAGTRTYDIFGYDLTGRSVRDLEPRALSAGIWGCLEAMTRDGLPQHAHLEFATTRGYARSYRVLRLPLGDDGTTVDRILVATAFQRGR
ncbi:MAG: PAS domain-containing protein [Alphaproteobacteria bacterium]|nr:PAS domain-containing protein [Alphaproteobacteria bacterium]